MEGDIAARFAAICYGREMKIKRNEDREMNNISVEIER